MPSRPDPRQAIGGTQEGVRRHNLATMVGHLHVAGPLRRAQLTALMGLNRSTIADLVAELVSLGMVREERGLQPGAGRPSPVVRLRSDAVQVLAADIGVRRADVALVGLGGVIVASRRLPPGPSTPEAVARRVADAVALLRHDPAAGRRILGLGVAVPGVVRQEDGNVRFAPNLRWEDVPLRELLSDRVPGLQIRVGNDADLGAIAEHRRGAARGIDDVVFIAGEEGVGCGMIVGGHPVHGAGGYAGELGHMTIWPGGRHCRCGARGCWETEIGAAAIARALGPGAGSEHAAAMPSGGATTDTMAAMLRSPSAQQRADLSVVGEALGIGLGNVVNLLNPSLVILGGLLGLVLPVVRGPVEAALARTVLRAPGEQVRITVPELGAHAVLLGASELAWLDLLADPAATLAARPPSLQPH